MIGRLLDPLSPAPGEAGGAHLRSRHSPLRPRFTIKGAWPAEEAIDGLTLDAEGPLAYCSCKRSCLMQTQFQFIRISRLMVLLVCLFATPSRSSAGQVSADLFEAELAKGIKLL